MIIVNKKVQAFVKPKKKSNFKPFEFFFFFFFNLWVGGGGSPTPNNNNNNKFPFFTTYNN